MRFGVFFPGWEDFSTMDAFADVLARAFGLIARADAALLSIIALSLQLTGAAVFVAAVIGLPLGALVGALRFPGRGAVTVVLNALMGLPPVVVGLFVYLLLSASGPLGPLRLLYTPAAMVIAQVILVTPIISALTKEIVAAFDREYAEEFASLGVAPWDRIGALLRDARYSLLTVALAGFGRAVAEVGAIMIVGGNIAGVTRVMTTSIALETSKGDLELALALGVVLLAIALLLNAAVMAARASAVRAAYA